MGSHSFRFFPRGRIVVSPIPEMPNVEVALQLRHAERDEVALIKFLLRVEMKGKDMVNLKMRGS